MDEMRKMLDSLMGQSRDASLDEAKKNKGKNFTAPNVCKFHLLGFCPQNELGNSKLTTKRNLGECTKVHSDAMKQEYEEHPEKAKFQDEYEKQLLPFLESQVREADAWVSREKANARKGDGKKEETTVSSMPVAVKEQVAQLTADMNKMMAAAEELAEKGDIGGSKFKVVLADEIKKKVTEIEEQYPSYTVTLKEEWVCDICGTRTEAVTEQNETRFAAHFTGKVHQGYAKIREWVKILREKQRKEDGGRREGSRDRDRRRSRDREKPGAGEKDQERRRRRSRSRDKDKDRRDKQDKDAKEAEGERDEKDEKDEKDKGGKSAPAAADRERDRGGDRDRDRERDRRDRRRSRSREDRGRRRG
mmetsp:Transcript_40595/g.116232  ORF Transcript_40595/g.116232 Transcript_40595/m.116232 type:complete len:361 (-) Transcript_40595:8-1090(-)